MRLNLFSQLVTLLSLSSTSDKLSMLVHSVALEGGSEEVELRTAGTIFDAASADQNLMMQSDAETDSHLQSRVDCNSEFFGAIAGALLPSLLPMAADAVGSLLNKGGGGDGGGDGGKKAGKKGKKGKQGAQGGGSSDGN